MLLIRLDDWTWCPLHLPFPISQFDGVVCCNAARYGRRLPYADQAQGPSDSGRAGSREATTGDLVPKLRRVLTLLDEARDPGDLAQPGYRLHPLKGDMAGLWSIRVSVNWRVVFRFEENEAVDVDLVDYH